MACVHFVSQFAVRAPEKGQGGGKLEGSEHPGSPALPLGAFWEESISHVSSELRKPCRF